MSLWGKIFGMHKNPEYERGIRYFNEGRYELAVAELEKAIPKAGKDDPFYALGLFYAAESHAHIGMAKYLAGKTEEALAHFEKAVAENPTYPDLYYRMGVIQHKLGRVEEALDMLRRATELNPDYFEATVYLGIALHESGRAEEAAKVFERALAIGSSVPNPISKFLSDHLAGKETEIPPLCALRRIVRIDSDFDAAMKEGIENFNTGNYEAAARSFSMARDLHPEYADVRFKLGLAHLKCRDHESARMELLAAVAINDKYAEAYFYLGANYMEERKYAEALENFEKAASIRSDYADLQCFLGIARFYLGDLVGAREALKRSLDLSPTYSKARYYYGLLLYAMGDGKRAIEYLREATRGEERVASLDLSVALVNLREGNLEEAMKMLRDILEAGGESADVLYFIGECYLKSGRGSEAERFFRRALEINPAFLRAKEKLALILFMAGSYDEAERLLESAQADFSDVYKMLGDIKFHRGDLESAERCYRKSLAVNAEYADAALSLALTLRKSGRSAEADDLLRRLVERYPENVLARSLLGSSPLDSVGS